MLLKSDLVLIQVQLLFAPPDLAYRDDMYLLKSPAPALFYFLCSLGRCKVVARGAISYHRLECGICYIGGSFIHQRMINRIIRQIVGW